MKKILAMMALVMALILAAAGLASATTLTFDTSVLPAGVTLSGNMYWEGVGGGHLAREREYWLNGSINFATPTTVNSFQMNALPWPDFDNPMGIDPNSRIAAFDAGNNQLWSTTVDLTTYTNWANWLTVNVDTANVASLTFYGSTSFWPSIDNLRINEAAVPLPGAVWLLGSGLLGLVGWRRKFRK